jgi:hypothetical protein
VAPQGRLFTPRVIDYLLFQNIAKDCISGNHHRRALRIFMQMRYLLRGTTPMLSMGDDRASHHKPVLDIAVLELHTSSVPMRINLSHLLNPPPLSNDCDIL